MQIKTYKYLKDSISCGLKDHLRLFITIIALILVLCETILVIIHTLINIIIKSFMSISKFIQDEMHRRKLEEIAYKNSPAYYVDTLAANSRRETQSNERMARIPQRQNIIVQTGKYQKPDYSNNAGSSDFYKSLGNGTNKNFMNGKSPKW
jgi:hypothetical protein